MSKRKFEMKVSRQADMWPERLSKYQLDFFFFMIYCCKKVRESFLTKPICLSRQSILKLLNYLMMRLVKLLLTQGINNVCFVGT